MKIKKRKYWEFLLNNIVLFGKYCGKKYKDVLIKYLEWFSKNAYHQMVNRRKWAVMELKRREAEAVKSNVNICHVGYPNK